MILYFTGTGNSRYLAERLGKRLHDEVMDAVSFLQRQEHPVFQSERPYVIVAPTYAWRLPRVFETWLRKCRFDGSRKIYYVLNCGSDIGAADRYAQTLSRDMKLEHMGMAEVVMPENYIALFSAPDEQETVEIIAKADAALIPLAEAILDGKPFEPKKITPLGQLCSGVVNDAFYRLIISSRKFYVTDACISCGQCVGNCMLNNIKLQNGKPVWGEDCTHCMACICKCPAEAIEYGRHSRGLRRYTCPKE